MSANKSGNKWINGLDTLRFFLAFIVLLSHFPNPWVASLKQSSFQVLRIAGGILPNFFCGIGSVIAFFIISGFVIHYPNKNGIDNVGKFLIRRWVRIIIPLFVIGIISTFFKCFSSIPVWSLYCELIYYTIYPLLIKIRISWQAKFLLSFLIAAIFIFICCYADINSFVHQRSINFLGGYWQLGNLLTWIIGLPCWLLGVILADRVDQPGQSPVSFIKIISLRLSVLIMACLLDIGYFHYYLSYVISMNFFALLLFYWIWSEIIYYRYAPPVNTFERWGKFSYSIYLCHGVFLVLLEKVMPLNNLTYLVFVGLTLVMSYVFFLLVEKPSHKLAQSLSNSYTKRFVPSAR